MRSKMSLLFWIGKRFDLTIQPHEFQVRIKGAERLAATLPVRAFSVWASDYSLAFGNEMTLTVPG